MAMTDSERLEESIRKDAALRQQVRRVNVFLLLILAALIAGPLLVTWWINRQIPMVNTVSIDHVRPVGETSLCYGEPLVYAYAFHAKGSGVLVRDRSLWRLSPPPKTMIYSTSRRFILTEAIDQQLTETWYVPQMFRNPETDLQEQLPPGRYRLIFAVSSPSRSTVVSIANVDFELRGDCE